MASEQIALTEAEKHHTKRLAALRQARGIWRERQDLPDASELRREWEWRSK